MELWSTSMNLPFSLFPLPCLAMPGLGRRPWCQMTTYLTSDDVSNTAGTYQIKQPRLTGPQRNDSIQPLKANMHTLIIDPKGCHVKFSEHSHPNHAKVG